MCVADSSLRFERISIIHRMANAVKALKALKEVGAGRDVKVFVTPSIKTDE